MLQEVRGSLLRILFINKWFIGWKRMQNPGTIPYESFVFSNKDQSFSKLVVIFLNL